MIEQLKSDVLLSANNLPHKFSKIFDVIIKDKGITKIQAMLLLHISKGKSSSINELSCELDLNQGNTSSLCKKLEHMGYLQRIRNKDDERIVNVTLSKKGLTLVKKIYSKIDELEAALETFDKEKLDSIVIGIKNLNEFLDYVINKEGE